MQVGRSIEEIYEDVLSRLTCVKRVGREEARACCPAHDSQSKDSLQVGIGRERDRVVITRWCACELSAILGAIGMQEQDIFVRSGEGARRMAPRKPRKPRFDPYAVRQPAQADAQEPAQTEAQELKPVRDDLEALLARWREALWAPAPGSNPRDPADTRSIGLRYMEDVRKIPREVLDAHRAHIGYCPRGEWPYASGAARYGRVVFGCTTPAGLLVNIYGRACALDAQDKPHMFFPRPKGSLGGKADGYFLGEALLDPGADEVWVCEGVFDALALVAAGCPHRVLAIVGSYTKWRWEWAKDCRRLVLAFDYDQQSKTGQGATHRIGAEARERGIDIAYIPPGAYGAQKDLAAAWAEGVLAIGFHAPPADESPRPPGALQAGDVAQIDEARPPGVADEGEALDVESPRTPGAPQAGDVDADESPRTSGAPQADEGAQIDEDVGAGDGRLGAVDEGALTEAGEGALTDEADEGALTEAGEGAQSSGAPQAGEGAVGVDADEAAQAAVLAALAHGRMLTVRVHAVARLAPADCERAMARLTARGELIVLGGYAHLPAWRPRSW